MVITVEIYKQIRKMRLDGMGQRQIAMAWYEQKGKNPCCVNSLSESELLNLRHFYDTKAGL